MSTFLKQAELNFWNIAIPLLTRSQVVRKVVHGSMRIYQDVKMVKMIALMVVFACAGFAVGLLAYSVSLIF